MTDLPDIPAHLPALDHSLTPEGAIEWVAYLTVLRPGDPELVPVTDAVVRWYALSEAHAKAQARKKETTK